MTLPSALLLGGGPIAPPVARSLGATGVTVDALGGPADPVRHSRYCREFVDLGAGEGVQERWLEWLAKRAGSDQVILPCNDDALELISRNRDTLLSLGYCPAEADDELVLAMLDKYETYRRARAADVPAPKTVLLNPGDDAAAATAGLEFPLALKPRHSHLFARHFGMMQKVLLAHSADELAGHARRMGEFELDMLVTEIVPGRDDAYHSYYTYVDGAGEPLFHLTKHKLRQYPPGFGLSTYHAIDRDEATIEVGRRFVEGLGLRGLASVEFKRDARDGELRLIECNHRLTLGYELVRHAGIDLALLAYSRAAGLQDPPLSSYRTGIHMWHPVEDVRALLTYRRRGEMTVGGWLRSLLRPQHFPMFSWRDPKPTLMSLRRFPRRLARGVYRDPQGATPL